MVNSRDRDVHLFLFPTSRESNGVVVSNCGKARPVRAECLGHGARAVEHER